MKEILSSTYLYAILIFLGFYNLFCFYDYFGINITSYLTTGELLLSFLQLTMPIVNIMLVLLIFIMGTLIVQAAINNKEQGSSNVDDEIMSFFLFFNTCRDLIKRNKENNFFSRKNLFINLGDIFMALWGLFIVIFYIAFTINFIFWLTGKYDVNPIAALIGSGFWLLIFDNSLKILKNIRFKNYIRFIIIFLFFIALINMFSTFKAKQIVKAKKGTESIVFEYNDTIVKSDTNFVFIGRTENYLFLRDLNKEMNFIYSKDKIGKIILKDIK